MRRWVNSGKLRSCGVAGIVFANGFTPREDSAVKLWYRSDMGITQASNLISTWAEQSGAGSTHDWTAATTARPTYTASDSAFGNRPSLTFDGVANTFAVASQTPAASGVTILMAYRPAINNATMWLLSDIALGGASLLGQTATGYRLDDEIPHSSTPTVTITVATHVLTVDAANGAQRYWLDDATIAKAQDTQAFGTFIVQEFGQRAGANFFQGKLSEVVVCSGVLSDARRKRMMRYMGAYSGVAVA